MAELPFLVVHGALVWKASVAGIGALGVKTASWLRDRRSAKFVGRATKHYTATATGLEPGPILVRGHLRGGGAQSFEHTTLPVVHSRDEGVYLDIEGERIDFDGEIVVGCGTENRTAYLRPPAGAPAIDATRRGAQRLSIVRADDEVLVAGTLRRTAAGDADYRDSAGGWRLAPFPRQGAIGLVAKGHRARAMPVSPFRTVLTFGFVGLIAMAGMCTYGSIKDSGSLHGAQGIHDLTVAAAMPGTRAEALAELDHHYIDLRTPDAIDKAIALREMLHGCGAAVDLMLDEGRLEQALDASRRCGLDERELDALVLLGRYGDAAALPTLRTNATNDERALVAIGTGHFAEAAPYSDACGGALLTTMATPDAAPPEVMSNGDARCSLLATQLLPRAKRAAAADTITTDGDLDTRLAYALVDLDRSSTLRDHGDIDRAALDLINGEGEPSTSVWTSHPGDLTPARAVFEVYRGHFDQAQDIAGALIKQASATEVTATERFAALIALRAGRPVPAEWLQHDSQLPEGSVFLDGDAGAALVIARGDAPSLAHGAYGLIDATHGDGSTLATERHDLTLGDALKLIAVLPRVVSHRDEALEFARALRSEALDATQGPFHVVRVAAMRRDLARATGDAGDVARWQSVIDGHMAVIADRDRLLALLAR